MDRLARFRSSRLPCTPPCAAQRDMMDQYASRVFRRHDQGRLNRTPTRHQTRHRSRGGGRKRTRCCIRRRGQQAQAERGGTRKLIANLAMIPPNASPPTPPPGPGREPSPSGWIAARQAHVGACTCPVTSLHRKGLPAGDIAASVWHVSGKGYRAITAALPGVTTTSVSTS
jgi:hypothetical protein